MVHPLSLPAFRVEQGQVPTTKPSVRTHWNCELERPVGHVGCTNLWLTPSPPAGASFFAEGNDAATN